MNRKNLLFTFIIVAAALFASFYLFSAKSAHPLYYEANENNSSAAFQNKDSLSNSISDSRNNIITRTVKEVSPAVVGINVTEIREEQYNSPFNSFFDDPFFQQFFGSPRYKQEVKELGSGFIISPDGYIVTNDHVAGNASKITVTLTNGKEYEAKVIGTDHATDICLIKVDANNLPHEVLGNSDDEMIGEWVIALGNPFGLFEVNDQPTVTVGVISAKGMNLEPMDNRYYLNMLQTDAAINGGNSGGPLVNSLGQVIGMNTLIYTAGGVQGNIGLGFAIPINKVKRIVKELKENGKVDRDFQVGLRIQSIDQEIANYYHLNTNKGAIVTAVLKGTPAERAGIKPGDIIVQVENYRINDAETMKGVFNEFRPGQTITLKIIRDGKTITKQMKLTKQT
jgi:serine protease Do